MASTTISNVLFIIIALILSHVLNAEEPGVINSFPSLKSCKIDKIYQLGDSFSDTGNLMIEMPLTPAARLPYGETFFKKPTGRFSNGLLMIDFIAQAAGLPFLNPYENKNLSFENGANFAVAGATVLSSQTLALKNITNLTTNSSLNVQLGWMSTHFASQCINNTDCTNKLKNSLFLVGEIGVNDYNFALLEKKTIDEVRSMVPDVVQGIINATKKIMELGATRIIIPGNFPIGCMPIYLTAFRKNNLKAYDDQHCLKDLNSLVMYHNELLRKAVEEMQHKSKAKIIVYGDYYNAFMRLFTFGKISGFNVTSSLKACCGTGGDYNYDLADVCGEANISACSNPAQYINWDGIHLTQNAYKRIAAWLIRNNILPLLDC